MEINIKVDIKIEIIPLKKVQLLNQNYLRIKRWLMSHEISITLSRKFVVLDII